LTIISSEILKIIIIYKKFNYIDIFTIFYFINKRKILLFYLPKLSFSKIIAMDKLRKLKDKDVFTKKAAPNKRESENKEMFQFREIGCSLDLERREKDIIGNQESSA
jgi:hypothetical protein